jgi:lipoprotein-releasing system permease protein
LRVEWWIAGRYLRSRRASRFVSLITFIATAGVAVGVMALIVVTGVMSGLQRDLREKILLGSPHISLLTYGEGLRVDDWRRVAETAARDPEVVAAAPVVLSEGIITLSRDYMTGAAVVGVPADTGSASVMSLPRTFISGDLRFATRSQDVDGGVILGTRLADRLSAYPGSIVTMVSAAGSVHNRALGTVAPRFYRYEVTGLFESGMYEYDNNNVIMPLEAAQRFAGLDSAVTGVQVRVRDPWQADRVARRLEDTLGFPYRALDWQAQNHSLFSALKLEKLGMGVILALIILVAAFNIVSTLTMTVSDRTREIGILRAMGMTSRQIRGIFVAQGVVVGVIGTALGLAGGILVGQALDRWQIIRLDASVYFIDHLPVLLTPWDMALIVLVSLGIAAIATIYPAGRAAGLQPVDAIRHE